MKYKIGDKVELTNGCVVYIKTIPNQTENMPIYGIGYEHSAISVVREDEITRKIEN